MENTASTPEKESSVQLVPAGMLMRLLNFFIDFLIFAFFFVSLLPVVAPVYPLLNKVLQQQPLDLYDEAVWWCSYGLFMSIQEAAFRGKTIAKFLTGTRAVDLSGTPVSGQTAFKRGLIRILPFEFLSGITLDFSPPFTIHDRWSRSLVIDEARSTIVKNLP